MLLLWPLACTPVDSGSPLHTAETTDTAESPDTAASADTAETGSTPLPTDPTVLLPYSGFTAEQLGIVVNIDDPLSASIAHAYADAHGVPSPNIVELSLGALPDLSEADFAIAWSTLNASLPAEVQALLLTFYAPYRVSCMGASAAFALGFDQKYCQVDGPCHTTAASPYYGAGSAEPWAEFGLRPTMMLSGSTFEAAEAVINRGVASQNTWPTGDVYLVRTTDPARAVRYDDFDTTSRRFDPNEGLNVVFRDASTDASQELLVGVNDILGYQTGLTHIGSLDTLTFRPGALADHLTSYGGILDGSGGQMSIVDWLNNGATASYGTAIEPCNYEQKFPRATELWPAYFLGVTAVEAYWRSVEWPGEGNFVGDPLARPFGSRVAWADDALTIATTQLDRRTDYVIEAANQSEGPWEVVLDGIEGGTDHRRQTLTVEAANRAFYRLVAVE
jgi:uncharacterized protein (TIGR03790 family)